MQEPNCFSAVVDAVDVVVHEVEVAGGSEGQHARIKVRGIRRDSEFTTRNVAVFVPRIMRRNVGRRHSEGTAKSCSRGLLVRQLRFGRKIKGMLCLMWPRAWERVRPLGHRCG